MTDTTEPREQLLEAMSAVSEDRTCTGWAADWARTLHAEGGIWETLGRAVGWPTGNYDAWVWVSWEEAARLYGHEPSAASVVVPAADRAALKTRIAAAVQPLLMDTLPKPIAAVRADEVADVVLSVLPAPADRGAVLREVIERVSNERFPNGNMAYAAGAEWMVTLLERIAAESAAVDRVAADTPPASGRCPHGCDVSICPCLACEADQLDTEEAQQPERCANCGKPVRRITGTLAAWWVHDPDGHTACHPQRAATSPRAEPGPVVPAQPGCAECSHPRSVHTEGDDPVSPGSCADCDPDDDRHDFVAQPGNDTKTRTVAYRSRDGRALHCTRHTGEIFGFGWRPVSSDDLSDGGICTYPDCGVDVLIPPQPKEA